ncbi:uncharacterized protein LOC123528467 isoform X2 [Mercenaria mercenaria]|uniref:uncharacterized protein LOC123528467 isoform X2 n=1 Tax=Mercenaria mercenaria TaxID=6596 RepID=UPI00234FAA5D|nr:uncharacterized protein LOC123528467 isoform X2 [Mercenaria mercenaria]
MLRKHMRICCFYYFLRRKSKSVCHAFTPAAKDIMKNHLAAMIVYGLVMRNIEVAKTVEVDESCTMIPHKYIDAMVSFLKILSDYTRTGNSVKIVIKSEEGEYDLILTTLLTLNDNCKVEDKDEESEVDSVRCQFKHLLGTFNVELSAQQHTDDNIFVLLVKIETDQRPPKLTELCTQATSKCGISIPITTTCRQSFCAKCKQLSWLSKNNGTTTAQNDHTFSTTKIKATDEGLQVSDIVISSISSFLGGVLCTLFTLFVYRFILQR